MKTTIKLLYTMPLLLLIAIAMTSCSSYDCWIDYTDEIREIAEPMSESLLAFTLERQHLPNLKDRFPTIAERDEMLAAIGCERLYGECSDCRMSEQSQCRYLGHNYIVHSHDDAIGYSIWIKRKTSDCYFGLRSNGQSRRMSCEKDYCIQMGQ